VRFCEECEAERAPQPTEDRTHSTSYDAKLDELRKGAKWQRVRNIAIKRCPLCARCKLAVSEIVDHVVPAREVIAQAQASGLFPYDKYAGYYLMTNLQGLCRPCHWIKTNEDKMHVGPWPDVMEKEAAAPKKVWTF
jgi:5-methylcytosine-specific restriction endonuclease McrA